MVGAARSPMTSRCVLWICARRCGTPGGEGGVHLLDGGEGPAGKDVVADDQNLTLDTSLARGPVGGQDADVEVVVAA